MKTEKIQFLSYYSNVPTRKKTTSKTLILQIQTNTPKIGCLDSCRVR